MKTNKKLIEALEAQGMAVSFDRFKHDGIERDRVCIRSTLSAALAVSNGIKKLPLQIPTNHETSINILTDNSDDSIRFRGGSSQLLQADLSGYVDMAPFTLEREKLVQSGLLAKLQTRIDAVTPKRRRKMSEHDGDWDYARRFDIAPFHTTERVRAEERIIDIVCNFSISAWASAKDIDAYGALVWSLADIIENAGIRARIKWVQKGRNIDRENLGMMQEFILKEPWEYLPPSMLAATFTSRFYRRFSFSMIPVMADICGKTVNSSLGHTISENNPIVFADGVLTLGPDAHAGMTDEIQKQVMAAIGCVSEIL